MDKRLSQAGYGRKDARELIAGVPQEKIALWPSFQGGGHLVDTEKCRDIYILYDVYLDKEALSVKKTLLEKEAGK